LKDDLSKINGLGFNNEKEKDISNENKINIVPYNSRNENKKHGQHESAQSNTYILIYFSGIRII
jgi:hypothetical protein